MQRFLRYNIKLGFLFSLALSLTACTVGVVYTEKTEPLTTNMHNAEYVLGTALSDMFSVKEPITGAGIRGEWANLALGQTAKINGLDTINYADLRTKSILFGLYEKTTVMVYGQKGSELIIKEIEVEEK